jgi:flagellum-specific peptidoglycan hydrolase FlgJ
LLTTLERYKNVFTGKIDEFADRLHNAGYAEDPEYAKKVKQVYNS